ncbi:MAG TPA: hypothetical protein VMF65_18580 [Acidimicrobiales bacterium]|nr:hypothetical protein [Acidimicrobiales bacterium]
MANIGVHGAPATFHLEQPWSRDITITTGLVDTLTIPTFFRLMVGGQFDARRFVTHRFALDDMMATCGRLQPSR